MRLTADPITIRGKSYPTIAAAARAEGVSPQAVSLAKKRGRLDYVGLGPIAAHKKAVAIRCDKFPDGKTFSSIKDAARALGAPAMTLYQARVAARAEGKKSCVTQWGTMAWLD